MDAASPVRSRRAIAAARQKSRCRRLNAPVSGSVSACATNRRCRSISTLPATPASATTTLSAMTGTTSGGRVEAGPLARLDEAGPVERMLPVLARQDGKLRLTQRVAAAETVPQTRVVHHHRLARDRVADRPEAHHERLRAGKHECAP